MSEDVLFYKFEGGECLIIGLQMHIISLYLATLLYTEGGEEEVGVVNHLFKATSQQILFVLLIRFVHWFLDRKHSNKVSTISLVRFQ